MDLIEKLVGTVRDLFTRADPATQAVVLVLLLISLVVAAGWIVSQWHRMKGLKLEKRTLRAERDALNLQIAKLDAEKESLNVSSLKSAERVGEAQKRLGELQQERKRLALRLTRLKEERDRFERETKELEGRFVEISKIDQDVWLTGECRPESIPDFKARSERRTRFVTFVNLKGGVGKTTLVANLGAGFASSITGRASRVLLVDLDFQGTLSNMCVEGAFLEDRRTTRRTSARLLDTAADPTQAAASLSGLVAPLSIGGGGVIVANEEIDEADFRAQARYAVNREEVRFRHRRLMHTPETFDRYDLVFFDCPPRLTTSTINALLASDYVVVPTSPHPNDVDAVRRTLKWLEKLRGVPPYRAELAAVILNRTYRKGTSTALTADEKRQWERLQRDVHRFDPTKAAILDQLVPNSSLVSRYAASHLPLGANPEGKELYEGVARELARRIEA
jgi:cellulose biosynthesis protein BcsQ/cell division protein FtsL